MPRKIAILPGATVNVVLNEINLRGYQLTRRGGEVLDPNTDLYTEAGDREWLYAIPEYICA